MTQTTNRFLDEFAKLMTDAAGAADGLKKEAETLFKSQGERFLREMDVVRREEFEAVKAMAEKARAENERLEARIAALETQLGRPRDGLSDNRSRPAYIDVDNAGPNLRLAPPSVFVAPVDRVCRSVVSRSFVSTTKKARETIRGILVACRLNTSATAG